MTLILSNDDVSQVLTMPECLNILEDAYKGLHTGTAITRRRSDWRSQWLGGMIVAQPVDPITLTD